MGDSDKTYGSMKKHPAVSLRWVGETASGFSRSFAILLSQNPKTPERVLIWAMKWANEGKIQNEIPGNLSVSGDFWLRG